MSKLQMDAVLRLVDVNINPQVFKKISRSVAGLPDAMQKTSTATKKATTEAEKLGTATKKAGQNLSRMERFARQFVQRMAQFAILLPIFATLNRAIQGGVKFLAEFETQLTNILRIDIEGLSGRLDEVAEAAFRIGTRFGAGADQVVDTIRVFKQAGETYEGSLEKAEAATLATRVSTLSLVNAQELLIATSRQFADAGLSAIEVIDKVAKVEDLAAVGAQDVAEAFRTGGNALAFAAKSFDDAIGLIAGLREQTRKSGREVGTFFKTLATRITAAGEPRRAVEALGIQVENLDGSLRPLKNILNDLKKSFDGLTESQQASAAKAIAGVRQFEGLIGTLSSLERANELSAQSANANGTALEKLEVIQGRLEDLSKKVVASFQELTVALGETGIADFFKDSLVAARGFAQALTGIAKIAGTLGIPLGPLLGVGAIKIGQAVFGITTGFATSVQKASVAVDKLAASSNAAAGAVVAGGAAGGAAFANTRTGRIRGRIDKAFGGAGGDLFGRNSAKFAKLFVASTAAAAGLNNLAQFLDKTSETTVNEFGSNLADTGSVLSKAAATGAQFALLGPQAALLAGTFSLVVGAGAQVVKAFEENAKLNREIAEARKKDAERAGFLAGVDKGEVDTSPIVDILIEGIRKGGGKLNAEVLDLVEQQVSASELAKGFKDFDLSKELLTRPVLSAIFKGADGFEDIGEAIGKSNMPMKTFRAELAKLEGLFEETNETTGAVTKGILTVVQSLEDLERFAKFAEVEQEFLEIRRQLAQTGDAANKIFKSELQLRKEELNALQLFQSQADRLISDLVQKASADPGELGFFGVGSGEQAIRFIADLQKRLMDFVRAGGELDSVDFRRDFEDILANASTGQQKLIENLFDILKMSFEEEIKIAKAKDAVVQASAQADLDRISRKFNAEQAASKATDELNKKLIDIGLNAGDGVDAINALAEGLQTLSDVEEAELELQAVRKKNAMETNRLRTELQAVTDNINSISAAEDTSRQTGEKLNTLLKKRADLEVELGKIPVENRLKEFAAEQKLADVRKKDQEDRAEQAQKLAEAQEKLKEEELELAEATDKARKSFEDFKRERIEDLFENLSDAQEALADAQSQVIDSTEELADAFKDFLDSILAFNDSMVAAQVEANLLEIEIAKLGGGLAGFQDRLNALDNAFSSAMFQANISLEQRIELERQLAQETLDFLRQVRGEIVSAGLEIFGQDAESNRALQEGIAGLRLVAEQLGGSFDNFLNLGEEQFRQISQSLLSLPVELRSKILSALETLPSTVGIGGFSVEELRTALGQVGAGISPEVGLPSIEELLSEEAEQLTKLQDLAIRDAELQFAQVLAAKEALEVAEAQLEEAQVAEERAREAMDEVNRQIGEEIAALDRAEIQRDLLAQQIIQANDAATVRAIERQAAELQNQNSVSREVGNEIVTEIRNLGSAIRGVLSAQAAVGGARGFIPNFAGGRLSPREAGGLLRAAAREKKAMPPGAGLAVANTSEAIIPMRNKGFIPNFQEGNSPISAGISAIKNINETVVAAIVRSVVTTLAGLEREGDMNAELIRVMDERLSKVIDELESISSSNSSIDNAVQDGGGGTAVAAGPVNDVNINVTTQQNSTVQVQGLTDLETALRDAIIEAQEQQVNAATVPINEAIQSIFSVLRERGLISSFGQGQ